MAARIAIVIEEEYHARNYLTGLVNFAHDEELEFHLVLAQKLVRVPKRNLGQKSTSYVEFGGKHDKLFEFLKQVDKVKNRKKSKSFSYTLKRKYPPLIGRLFENYNLRGVQLRNSENVEAIQPPVDDISIKLNKYGLLKLFRTIRSRTVQAVVFIIGFSFIGGPLRRLLSLVIREKKLDNELMWLNPDLVIYITSLNESTSIPLRRLCSRMKIPYLLIPDNWDNLSSKRTLWEKPDFVGVWGEQTRIQARRIHKLPGKAIISIGSPRLAPLFARSITQKRPLKTDKFRILFAGASILFDEQRFIVRTLQTFQQLGVEIKLTYRPYPWRKHQIQENLFQFESFELDPSIAEEISLSNFQDFSPKFEAYADLINSSDLVVGGLTTMVLESAMVGKNVIALVHKEGSSINSPHLGFQGYAHFEGLEKFPNISFCRSIEEYGQILLNQFQSAKVSKGDDWADARDWFYDSRCRLDFNENFTFQINELLRNFR